MPQACGDERLAAIAAKSLKECATTCATRATGWCAWATAPMNRTAACRTPWTPAALYQRVHRQFTEGAIAAGCGVDVPALRASGTPPWTPRCRKPRCAARRGEALRHRRQARVHSEHLGYLLNELQGLARQHPGAVW